MNNSIQAYKTVCKILGIKPAQVKIDVSVPEGAALVIVPDKVFTHAKLYKLAETFGKDQPHETYINKEFVKLYTKEQLSGKPTGQDYRYLFIPKHYNIVAGTVEEQRKNGGHVPSVLEAFCYFFTLRENGNTFDFSTTYIRHFDLPEQRLGDFWFVPYSFVYDNGLLIVSRSSVQNDYAGRVSVGGKLESYSSPSEAPFSLVIQEIVVNGITYVMKEDVNE